MWRKNLSLQDEDVPLHHHFLLLLENLVEELPSELTEETLVKIKDDYPVEDKNKRFWPDVLSCIEELHHSTEEISFLGQF